MEVSGQLYTLATLPLGKEPWYSLDRKLGGLHSCSEHSKEKISAPARNQTLVIQPVAWSLAHKIDL